MRIYRITREKYSGKLEASGRENRWNKEKQYVVYASSNRSLATLELVAHRNAIMEGVKYNTIIIHVPEYQDFILEVDSTKLPRNWHLLENKFTTQKLGSDWYVKKSSPILKVPSAIIKEEYNYVLNTLHPSFSRIKIESVEDFNWDIRLL